jgi:hypothetical protein
MADTVEQPETGARLEFKRFSLIESAFLARSGERLVVVHKVGIGLDASWGYTIWESGRCVAGACSEDWTAFDAQAAADRALSAVIAMDANRST